MGIKVLEIKKVITNLKNNDKPKTSYQNEYIPIAGCLIFSK